MKHIAALLTLLLLLVFAEGCSKKAESSTSGKRGLRQAAFPVEVMQVDIRPSELLVTAPGVIDAFERIQITARVPGVIDKVTFVEGQEVKRGQVLAYIDSRRYALGVSGARAAVEKAEATSADTEQSLKRRQNAISNHPGLIPGEEVETYKTRFRTAQADVSQAREALKLAQLNLEDSNVRAPVEGVIQTRNVETGQYVQAGTIIATLLQPDPMLLRFRVATSEAPRLRVGMPVEFTLKESENTYAAKVTLISAAADPESRLVPITAEVQADKKFWLRPGSFAQVRIDLTPHRLFPMIPQTATRPSDRGFLAYVVQGESVEERVLKLGLHTEDGWVEVRDGLQVGDALVTRGLEALFDKAKIRIASPHAPQASSSAFVPAGAHSESSRRRKPAGSGSPDTARAPASSPSGSP